MDVKEILVKTIIRIFRGIFSVKSEGFNCCLDTFYKKWRFVRMGSRGGFIKFSVRKIGGWEAYSRGLQLFLLIKRRGLFECEGDLKRIEFSG